MQYEKPAFGPVFLFRAPGRAYSQCRGQAQAMGIGICVAFPVGPRQLARPHPYRGLKSSALMKSMNARSFGARCLLDGQSMRKVP